MLTIRVNTLCSKWHFPFHTCFSLEEQVNTARLFTQGLQGMPGSQAGVLPNWAPLTKSRRDRQFLMLTAAQDSQVNCCIPQIMFSFWFHSRCILSHGARRLFAARGCPWYNQGQSERIERDRLSLNAKIKAGTYASSASDTNRGRGFIPQCQQWRAHEFCDAWKAIRQNTTYHSISPLLEITGPLTFLCVRDGFPICMQQISTEDAHGERAQVRYQVKEPVSNANLLVQRVLLPSSDAIILWWQHFLTQFLSCSSFLCYKQ